MHECVSHHCLSAIFADSRNLNIAEHCSLFASDKNKAQYLLGNMSNLQWKLH